MLSILKYRSGMTGTVSPLYEPAVLLERVGVVFGHDLTSEAALAKLSYLLGLPGLTTEDVRQQMSVSLRGELTEHTHMEFEHPNGYLPQHLADLTALSYAIAKGNLTELQGLMKADKEWLLNQADYSGNTPLVGLPPRTLKSLAHESSILRPLDLPSRSCGSCYRKEPRSTCATERGEVPCSSRQMPTWLIMSRCCGTRERISTPTRLVPRGCSLATSHGSGRPRAYEDETCPESQQ